MTTPNALAHTKAALRGKRLQVIAESRHLTYTRRLAAGWAHEAAWSEYGKALHALLQEARP